MHINLIRKKKEICCKASAGHTQTTGFVINRQCNKGFRLKLRACLIPAQIIYRHIAKI